MQHGIYDGRHSRGWGKLAEVDATACLLNKLTVMHIFRDFDIVPEYLSPRKLRSIMANVLQQSYVPYDDKSYNADGYNYRITVGAGSHPVASRIPREKKRPEWSNILTSTPYREGTRAETQSQQIRRKRGLDKTHSVDFGDFVEIISHVAEELRTTETVSYTHLTLPTTPYV